MKHHVKVYMESRGFREGDYIPCEWPECRSPAVDVHHIVTRGMGGSKKQDVPGNLVAYCRKHHSLTHGMKGGEE
jgi:hypothetical protein